MKPPAEIIALHTKTAETGTTAYDKLMLEGELGHAIIHDEFALLFQPQVRACDGHPVGVEEYGYVAPDPLDPHAAHSIYFQVLGEHGFVGLFLFVAILATAFFKAGNIAKNTGYARYAGRKDRKNAGVWISR